MAPSGCTGRRYAPPTRCTTPSRAKPSSTFQSASRAPGWRKDDYPQAVLGKLRWCFKYARENHLLPILLGDLFHHPRDISNQLLVELLGILEEPIWAVTGNHDCHQNSLTDADSLSVLQAAGRIRLLDRDGPVIMGCVILTSGAVVLSNLAVDIAYGLLDPRLRRE